MSGLYKYSRLLNTAARNKLYNYTNLLYNNYLLIHLEMNLFKRLFLPISHKKMRRNSLEEETGKMWNSPEIQKQTEHTVIHSSAVYETRL